jgi:hypothetical protein
VCGLHRKGCLAVRGLAARPGRCARTSVPVPDRWDAEWLRLAPHIGFTENKKSAPEKIANPPLA